MKRRKYTKIQVLEPEIVSMQAAGKTHREITEHFELKRSQVKKCLERRRIRERKQAAGVQPKPKGRPRKDGQPPHQSEAAELKGLRIMKKYEVLAEIRRPRKWQQMGQQVHKYENLLNREFHADKPNTKWVTDISYIQTGQGVLYLSMIRDLYDNSIVAYRTATHQTVNLPSVLAY